MKRSVKVPGKLVLCGEWSVLDESQPECSCVVVPVSRFLTATIEPSDSDSLVEIPDVLGPGSPPIRLTWSAESRNFALRIQPPPKAASLVLSAVLVASSFCSCDRSPAPFRLLIKSEISAAASEQKPGLGSSSAAVVGTVSSVLSWFGVVPSPLEVFKLAVIAQSRVPEHSGGSGFDLAVAAFSKPIHYRRTDSSWLARRIAQDVGESPSQWKNLADLVACDWPRLSIEVLRWPPEARFLACFSGSGASTGRLISAVAEAKKKSPSEHERLMAEMGRVALEARACLRAGESSKLPGLLRKNRVLLQDFQSSLAGVELETASLRKIVESAQLSDPGQTEAGRPFVGAKFSGAGGGDCAIAVVVADTPEQTDRISKEILGSWNSQRFHPLADLQVVQ